MAKTSNVVQLPMRKTAEQFVDDEVFFSKQRVVIGTQFTNVGQVERGRVWSVTRIQTTRTGKKPGTYVFHDVDTIHKLGDTMTLASNDGYTRVVRFGTLKYSAIWRLV